jgi:hypothetical protein
VKIARPDLAAFALAALGLLCLTVLLAMGRSVPDYLPLIVMTVVGTGGGLSLNTANGSETVSSGARTPSPAPATRAPVPAQRPAPAPVANGVPQ